MPKYILSGVNGNVGSLLQQKFKSFSEYSKSLIVTDEKIFVHIAAKSHSDYKDIVQSNLNYLCEVIEFCKINNIKKFIFFSAISIYTNGEIYSISKLLGEKVLKESGLEVLVIRLPMILTKEKKNGVLNRIVQKLEKNEDIVLYNGYRKFNNFISIDDIYNFISSYSFRKKYEIVDLASSKENKLVEIVKSLKGNLSSKSKVILSKQSNDFFNISIKKAKYKYQYNPSKTEKILSNWIKIRNKGK